MRHRFKASIKTHMQAGSPVVMGDSNPSHAMLPHWFKQWGEAIIVWRERAPGVCSWPQYHRPPSVSEGHHSSTSLGLVCWRPAGKASTGKEGGIPRRLELVPCGVSRVHVEVEGGSFYTGQHWSQEEEYFIGRGWADSRSVIRRDLVWLNPNVLGYRCCENLVLLPMISFSF